MSNIHAVLTGDLIKSRKADATALSVAFDVLRDAAADFGQAWDSDLRFTRYRGDGWQVVLQDPGLVLDALLFFAARLRARSPAIETRISAGIGAVTSIGTADLADATGPAFFISGDHLETMSRKRKLAIAGSGIGAAQAAIVDLAEHIASGWTPAQAEAVALSLDMNASNHETIAESLGVTRQAVQSRLASAGWSYFDNALFAMRNHDYAIQPGKDL
jgi:hypothetical protein